MSLLQEQSSRREIGDLVRQLRSSEALVADFQRELETLKTKVRIIVMRVFIAGNSQHMNNAKLYSWPEVSTCPFLDHNYYLCCYSPIYSPPFPIMHSCTPSHYPPPLICTTYIPPSPPPTCPTYCTIGLWCMTK